MAGLSGRDLTVLVGRALYPAPKATWTLEDLVRELGLSAKELVRQIEKRVVAQVRRRAAAESEPTLPRPSSQGWRRWRRPGNTELYSVM